MLEDSDQFLTSNKRVDVVTMIQLYLKSQQDCLAKASDIRVSIVGAPFYFAQGPIFTYGHTG